MVRVWDFLMRRKQLLLGFLLVFTVSAAFSNVYLHPTITREPINLPSTTPTTDVVAPSPESEPEPDSDPITSPVPDLKVHLAIATPTPEEVLALSEEAISVPRTNFGFTLPGNIVNLTSLNQIMANHQLEQVDTIKTWHCIVSATTASLIFGGIMACLARFLSKNMLQ